jgi:hypothetical protein
MAMIKFNWFKLYALYGFHTAGLLATLLAGRLFRASQGFVLAIEMQNTPTPNTRLAFRLPAFF